MNVNFTLPDPFVLDLLHVGLALAVLVLIIVALAIAKTKSGADKASALPGTRADDAKPVHAKTDHAEPGDTQPDATQGSAKTGLAQPLKALSPDAALQLLSLLQQEARLIDFLHEDLTGFSDADIGAVARVVHEGGRRVLKTYFELAPVREETEESMIELPEGFDAQQIRLTGNVLGKPPYRGTLTHRGWQIRQVKLPQLATGHRTEIIAPAEVEI